MIPKQLVNHSHKKESKPKPHTLYKYWFKTHHKIKYKVQNYKVFTKKLGEKNLCNLNQVRVFTCDTKSTIHNTKVSCISVYYKPLETVYLWLCKMAWVNTIYNHMKNYINRENRVKKLSPRSSGTGEMMFQYSYYCSLRRTNKGFTIVTEEQNGMF